MQEYTVKARDTLWKIARAHGTTVDTLAHLNGLKGSQVHHLDVGQKLKLPGQAGNPDCLLQLHFRCLDFNSFTPKTVKLEHDGKSVTHNFEDGLKSLQVAINDHAQGLKVWIEDMEKKMVQVMQQDVLAPGKWKLAIDSRQVSVKGNMLPQKGKQEAPAGKVQDETKKEAQKASGATAQQQTRTEGGTPMHALATIYTEQNLRLPPVNEEYRQFLIDSAKRHGQTPQALAALVDAEAAKTGKKTKNPGHWVENSNEGSPDLAQGLAQFFPAAWTAVFNDADSLLHKECASLSEKDRLKKRLAAKYAIDGSASYAELNLKEFEKLSKLSVMGLPPEEKAKMAYLLHHEGTGGALRVMGLPGPKGEDTEDAARDRLRKQVDPKGEKPEVLDKLIVQYGRSAVKAYRGWLYSYIDAKINVNNFLVSDAKLTQPVRSIADITAGLGAAPTPKPAPKPAAPPPAPKTPPKPPAQAAAPAAPSQSASSAAPVHGSGTWFDPLDVCVLRTARLSILTVKGKELNGAKFGMTRNGGKKAHQGIDLAANPGTPIRAVADGKVYTNEKLPKADYGNTIVLEVGIDDLPEGLAEYCRKVNPGKKTIGFFYAHLQEFGVPNGTTVHAGDIIGKTGCTGNAKSMPTIPTGAHLHFEVRQNALMRCGGLTNRLDPIPFIKNLKT